MELVPPKAVGGSVRCLTCTPCNSAAGKGLDQAVTMLNREMTGRGTKVRLDIFGTAHTTYFLSDSDAKLRLARLTERNPGAQKLRDELAGKEILLLSEVKRGPVWDLSRGITLQTLQPSPIHVAMSMLRSAYLMVFSLLGQGGYAYANSEALIQIRKQIMNPDEELVPDPIWELSKLLKYKNIPSNYILLKRSKPQFWMVKIGSLGVILPHGGTITNYENVTELPENITLERHGLVGWKPVKFGHRLELPLNKDSEFVNEDLFGRELSVPLDASEHRFIVVNQQGLHTTFLPIGRKRKT